MAVVACVPMPDFTAASDWEKRATEYSGWLPLLVPYGARLLELCAAEPGQRVLDLACGTGEPGLTLALAQPQVQVVGIDSAHAMAHAAVSAGEAEGLTNISFAIAEGERLPFADNTFDRVMCRFGLMAFDQPSRGLAEIARVLTPGGRLALAVWSVPETVLCPALALKILSRFTDIEWPRTYALSEPGLLARLCVEAGFGSVSEETFDAGFGFDSVEHFVERNLTGRFITGPMERLSGSDRKRFKEGLAEAAAAYVQEDGRVRLPQEALLVGGEKV